MPLVPPSRGFQPLSSDTSLQLSPAEAAATRLRRLVIQPTGAAAQTLTMGSTSGTSSTTIRTGTGAMKFTAGGILISGVIKRGNGASTTSLVNMQYVNNQTHSLTEEYLISRWFDDSRLSSVNAQVLADTTNGSLKLQVVDIFDTTGLENLYPMLSDFRWSAAMTGSLVRHL